MQMQGYFLKIDLIMCFCIKDKRPKPATLKETASNSDSEAGDSAEDDTMQDEVCL